MKTIKNSSVISLISLIVSMFLITCLIVSCNQTENKKNTSQENVNSSHSVLAEMKQEDSLFFSRIIKLHDSLGTRVEQAKEITQLFLDNPLGSQGYNKALRKVATMIEFTGDVYTRDSLIIYMQRTRKFLCSYEPDTMLIVSTIVEMMQVGDVPICVIYCPLTKELGQAQIESRGIIMINMYQVMNMFKFIINNIPDKYHISSERWLYAILAQELYHAQTPSGGSELKSDYVSMGIAGHAYVFMRLLDVSHYFYNGVKESSKANLSPGYFEAYEKFYNCARINVPQFASLKEYDRLMSIPQCPIKLIEYRECFFQNMQNIGLALFWKMRDSDPLILENTYSCMMASR